MDNINQGWYIIQYGEVDDFVSCTCEADYRNLSQKQIKRNNKNIQSWFQGQKDCVSIFT